MREDYPPALILRKWQDRYFKVLDTATVGRGYSSIADLVGKAVEESLELYLEVGAVNAAES